MSWGKAPSPAAVGAVATGLAQVPASIPVGVTSLFSGAQWEGDEPLPLVVLIGEQAGLGTSPVNLNSGAEDVSGNRFCVQIEYGRGNVSRKVLCDLRSGSIQLPPSQYCRASLLILGGLPAFNVPMAIAEGSLSSLDNPTFTTNKLAGTVPAGARWFEFVSPGTMTFTDLTGQYSVQGFWNGGPQNPAHAPVRITGQTYSFSPDVNYTQTNILKFVLSL